MMEKGLRLEEGQGMRSEQRREIRKKERKGPNSLEIERKDNGELQR